MTTLTTCIALIRGINVGKARRLAMADLRTLIADCGGNNVRTLLNSGNAVFETAEADVNAWSQRIRTGIEQRAGFSAEVIVLSADNLRCIVNDNPLAEQELDSARYLVAFVADPQILDRLQPLSQ
ncbi:MAG: DUF1697 domain-containing protein, partial [Burkholderiales bacterium]|nr:DUF1697 domain-containing protein [Burkholderiales bacterium]